MCTTVRQLRPLHGVSHQLWQRTCSGTSRTPPSPTRTPSGPARSQRPARPHPRRQPGRGQGLARSRGDDRGAPDAVPPRRHVGLSKIRRGQAPRPSSRQPARWNAALPRSDVRGPHRHRHPPDQQPGRTRPATLRDPAEDQRGPLGQDHRDRYTIADTPQRASTESRFTASRALRKPWIPPISNAD